MKTFEVSLDQLRPMTAMSRFSADDRLLRSISEHGVLQPLVVCHGRLCDGNRRLAALKQLGIEKAPCVEAEGSPALLFAQLNSHRELTAFELAAAYAATSTEESSVFFSVVGMPESPQLQHALSYIAQDILGSDNLPEQQMPLNIWRELGHLGDDIGRFARDLLRIPGTVAEKRNIAMFLRQAKRKEKLPASLPGTTAGEVLANLQPVAQPRRTEALARFTAALQQNPLPAGVSIKIDQTFSLPGMLLTINLTRRHCNRLSETQSAVEAIFTAVEEL